MLRRQSTLGVPGAGLTLPKSNISPKGLGGGDK